MNDIKKAINYIQNMDLSVFTDKQEACEAVDFITEILERSTEPTASEFLSKAKAICNSEDIPCSECPLTNMCGDIGNLDNETDLVRKVMDYQIKEDANGRID